MIGCDLGDAPTGAHEDWDSFEGCYVKQIAAELAVLGEAMKGDLPDEDGRAYVQALAPRVRAGAELCERLRNARWGDPAFGGGEAKLAADREALMAKRAEHAEAGDQNEGQCVAMSASTFPGLVDAGKRAEKAVEVVRSAIDHVKPPREGESLDDVALRLRGASVLALTAGQDLATVSGWHEAASAASEEADR